MALVAQSHITMPEGPEVRKYADALNEVLAGTSELSEISLHIADIDDRETEKFMKSAGDFPLSGNGETYWVRKGAIIARLLRCDEEAKGRIRDFTRQLLE